MKVLFFLFLICVSYAHKRSVLSQQPVAIAVPEGLVCKQAARVGCSKVVSCSVVPVFHATQKGFSS